tara:strand:- start:449 stop:601 length:153 start_codon:yes stop_codon:yes gene_type:complete
VALEHKIQSTKQYFTLVLLALNSSTPFSFDFFMKMKGMIFTFFANVALEG